MKLLHTFVTGCLLAASLLGTSCTTNFEEINTNPNKMTVGDIEASRMLEPIIYGASRQWQYYTWYWNDELIQFTAFTGGTTRQEHRYFISDQDWKGVWNFYSSYANNTLHMASLAAEDGDVAIQAMALTLKVLFMSNLTDMFGDIPYSEAFQGREEGGTKTPKYDSQQEVYEQMFADLEAANELYATQPTMLDGNLDGLYGGDMAAWRKFNNTLYMRLLCRVGGRSEMNVGQRMRALLADPGKYPLFASNADNARVDYTGIKPYVNYFTDETENEFTASGRKLTEQFIKMTVISENGIQLYQDPRLPIWGKKHPIRDTWKGTISGCTNAQQSDADSGASRLNYEVFCRALCPSFFLSYDELEFILAEAALKGWIDGGEQAARTYYEAAVTASMEKWNELGAYSLTPVTITADDVATFLASDLASWDGHTNKEQLIGEQKYLALFWTGMEAYHEYRRTGYPVLTIGEGTFNDHILPTRFAYPATSVATNAAHVEEALQRMGGENNMKTPVWWSKQAIGR